MSKNPITGLSTQTPTVSTVTQYAANDAVGGLLSFTLSSDASNVGGGGISVNLIIIDKDKQDAPLILFLFDQTFTPTADNAPINNSLTNCIGYISVASTDYVTAGAAGDVAEVTKAKALKPATTGLTTIYGQLKYAGSSTPKWSVATGNLIVKLGLVQD